MPQSEYVVSSFPNSPSETPARRSQRLTGAHYLCGSSNATRRLLEPIDHIGQPTRFGQSPRALRRPRACIRPLAWPELGNNRYAIQESPYRPSRLFQDRFEAGRPYALSFIRDPRTIAVSRNGHFVQRCNIPFFAFHTPRQRKGFEL